MSAAAKDEAAVPVLHGETKELVLGQDISFVWSTLFRSAQIDAFIKRAFKANPDIGTAQAALRQTQEYTVARQGFFYPAVGASHSPGQQGKGTVIRSYSNPADPKYSGAAYYNFYAAQLTVGYVPDMFGANRRQIESEQARAERQRIQLEATHISLASNVVAAVIQEASLRAQIEAQLKIVSLNRQALEIVRNQLNLGYVSEKDVTQQERGAALAQQALVPLQQQLEQTRDLMRALAGNTPDQDVDIEEMFSLDELHLLQELPLSLPSRLVEQRPDVRIAEAQLHYASAKYGVAVANTMPQFAITGAIGGMASSPAWMFKNGGEFFDLTGNVSQVIFDRRTLRAKPRAAQQSLMQAGKQYRSVVMAALQNVADALYVIQSDEQALAQTVLAAQAASKAGELTRKQYEAGAVDFQTLLVAQQNEQLATINLVRAQTNRLGDTALLFQALGGDWWSHDEKEAVTAKR